MRREGARHRCGLHRGLFVATVSIAIVGTTSQAAVAQSPDAVEAGSRVRITAPSLGLTEAVGTVQERTGEAVVVQLENPSRVSTIARAEIAAMDVSVGTRRSIGRGLGIGFLAGAGTGALIGLASGDDEGTFLAFTAEEKAVMIGLGLGAVGAVVGLIAGALNRSDVWAPVSGDPSAFGVRPLLARDGAGVVVGFAVPLGRPR